MSFRLQISLRIFCFALSSLHFPIRFNKVRVGYLAKSAKRGHDSTFAVEANTKTLCPKLSRFRLAKIMNRGRVIWGRVIRGQGEYQVDYRVDYLAKGV